MSLTNLKLYSIVFIDSLCLGFLPPIMSSHLMSFGGTHLLLGTIGSIHAAAQFIAGPLIQSWNNAYGRKISLLISLFIYFVTYCFLGTTRSLLVFVILRTCFALTNQSQSVAKGIAANVNTAEVNESVNNLMNIVGVAGLIIGPIIGGLFFDNLGFYHVTLTASMLLLLSFCIALTLPPQTPSKETTSFTEKLQGISCIKECNIFLLLLKALYMSSLSIFFIKFSYALRLNQGLTFTVVGLTYAYQSLITFLSTFAIHYFSPPLYKEALLQWLFILGISLSVLCNTNIYLLYLGSFVVMAIAHGVVSRLFRELFAQNSISNIEDSITVVISVVIPAVLGYACDFYGLAAFNAFVILPIFCDLFIVFAFLTINGENKDMELEKEAKAESLKKEVKEESKLGNKKTE